MEQEPQRPSVPTSASFAGLLASLTLPEPGDEEPANAGSDGQLGDDAVTLSYDGAQRAHARYKPAGEKSWPIAQDGGTGEGPGLDTPVLGAKESDGTPTTHTGDATRAVEDWDLRSVSVTVRLSRTECARLHKLALEAGVTVSAYLRSCTFEAEALRAEVKAALADLRAGAQSEKSAAPAKKWRVFAWLARLVPGRRSLAQAG